MFDPLAIQARQAERRRLREAASAAPWAVGPWGLEMHEHYATLEGPKTVYGYHATGRPDAEFIAHARNDDPAADVDACLAEIERLRSGQGEYRCSCDRRMGWPQCGICDNDD